MSSQPTGAKKRIWVKILVPIILIGIQLELIYLLYTNFIAIQAGDNSMSRILNMVVCALVLFFVALLTNPRFINGVATYQRPKEVKEEKFKVRIVKHVNLNIRYGSDIIRKCPKCKFENPRHRSTCINCGSNL